MDNMTIAELHSDFAEGRQSPREFYRDLMRRIRGEASRNIWIHILDDEELEEFLAPLDDASPTGLPLYGIPFALKDNIDLAGIPTTAGCPEYAYTPGESAFVVQQLIQAGAVPVGKTNLDQFATGLVGTRSPFGACANAFDDRFIAGGSSSGSAVATALNLVSFSLGTDTAGSGRIPAAFNNIVGVKPTRGLLSNRGVVPACKTLDCVCIFAATATDAHTVLNVVSTFDDADPYARPDQPPRLGPGRIPTEEFRFGVPADEQLEFFGDDNAAELFRDAVARLEAMGGTRVRIDFSPFLEAAGLLYQGPWIAERFTAIREFIEEQPDALFPVTREIIERGRRPLATDAFAAEYRLQELRRETEMTWGNIDLVATPTAGTIHTIDAVNNDPIALNNQLGHYTNFMNLLDLSAVAVPAGFNGHGLPFGCTLFAPAFHDEDLLAIADRFHRQGGLPLTTTGQPLPEQPSVATTNAHSVPIAVCGAHMEGLPLNHQLQERGARLVNRTYTAPEYRLYALPGGPPERPGLARVKARGEHIGVEVWDVPTQHVGSFLANIPSPLGLGKVRLADGQFVTGFICETADLERARDITDFGDWRSFLNAERA
ncbi:allophanate hydrolase [Aquisalimonas sp. 2447]|uniref:allophanate hydrolase n=1 Tax=Aquisalimonas sp. 2447 TaxID=2740807 RepID=UPI00143244A5|nr:allophanate hydrolase [Aquisalimonas sp. 2447]QIT54419.1 allophanate hydrolase [Aquisalimonas sp. 2447]